MKSKRLPINTCFLIVSLIFSACSQRYSPTFDIIVGHNLTDAEQQLVCQKIWDKLGNDARIGIGVINNETAFSVSSSFRCEEVAGKLAELNLVRIDEDLCVWRMNFGGENEMGKGDEKGVAPGMKKGSLRNV
ncbi:MAG: hypothetical protein CML13_10450 [Puniceicoccaceae bacterium]|nr:hypothetical protein [Puniceicoccaceae bacterium]|tara:strand:+ start:1870 stop:2265 length:396 start_codon:yes stop_codon:yes gene_type:complete